LPQANKSAYSRAGVDIDSGNRAVALMADAVRSTYGPEVLAGIGNFGGLYSAVQLQDMQQPVLVASTDSIGTKTILANKAGKFRGLGHDIVNHCIDDILVQGAQPLFFLDYVAAPRLHPETIAEIVSGMAEACRRADCAILGGETAELPGVYEEGQLDVVGAIVGVVEKEAIIDGSAIAPGDQLIGLPSSGPHTNGYSLIRHVFGDTPLDHVFPELGVPLADALLQPHHSYLDEVRRIQQEAHIKGLVHITGGGYFDNIPRVLPQSVAAVVRKDSWTVPPLFRLIQKLGQVDEDEMYRVFNMGVGMIVVVAHEELQRALSLAGPRSVHMGEIIERTDSSVLLV